MTYPEIISGCGLPGRMVEIEYNCEESARQEFATDSPFN